mgnify:CR=1 FL=1
MYNLNVPVKAKDPPWFAVQMGSVADSVVAKIRTIIDNTNILARKITIKWISLTPHTRRVKTVFFAMRHALDDMQARQECMDIMRELFRQFMSVLIQEKTRVEEEHIYLDPRISFQEIDKYFLSGCACAFFQIATDVFTDLSYNEEEWE